jgi:hypothetical protein
MVAAETTTLRAACDLDQNRPETRMRFYDSQTQAMQRVERLKDEAGYWPGVIGPDRHGHYRLSYDPDLAGAGQAKTGALPERISGREHPQHQSAGRDAPAPQAEPEAEAWLHDDLEEGPGAEDSSFARLTEAELEAGLCAEADWGL